MNERFNGRLNESLGDFQKSEPLAAYLHATSWFVIPDVSQTSGHPKEDDSTSLTLGEVPFFRSFLGQAKKDRVVCHGSCDMIIKTTHLKKRRYVICLIVNQ